MPIGALSTFSDWPYGDNWIKGLARKFQIDQAVMDLPHLEHLLPILLMAAELKEFGQA